MSNKIKVMLDSGAFGAWLRGTTIPVKEYIAYVKDNEEWIDTIVGMDVIPGQVNVVRTPRQIEEAAKGSYRNHQIMKDAGLHPIPVFHQTEDWKHLEQYLKDGDTYIGLATLKDLPKKTWEPWLDDCFSILSDGEGRPVAKTHGFAITHIPLMQKYPWYSCDSTTWSLSPGFGYIFVPPYVKGKPNYMRPPGIVPLSGVTSKYEGRSSRQIDHHCDKEEYQGSVKRFLEEEVGINIYEARYHTTLRRKATLVYFLRFAEHHRLHHFKKDIGSFTRPDTDGMKPIKLGQLKMIFATTMKNLAWAKLMNELGAFDRLLNYNEMCPTPHGTFEQYVKSGLPPPSNRAGLGKKANLKNWGNEWYLNIRRLRIANPPPVEQEQNQ